MEISKETRNKVLLSLLFVTIGVLFLTVIGDYFTDPNLYSKTIEILDSKRNFVLGLSGTSSSASILIALIPTDATTPIANQFANLSGYLTIILAILFFEKYLLTIIATIVCRYIVPAICIVAIACLYIPKVNITSFIRPIIIKVAIFSVILMSIIPISVQLSKTIDETYQLKVNQTVTEIESEETNNFFDKIVSFTVEVKDKITNWLNNMMEYVAISIVTSCLIPIATLFIFVWITNQIFGTHFRQPNLIADGKAIGGKISKASNGLNKIINDTNDEKLLEEKE